MNVAYTIAGVATVVIGVLFLLSAYGRAKKTADGEVEIKKTLTGILGAFLFIIGSIALFLQILAAAGVGSQANDPYAFNWISGLIKSMMNGELPQLK